MHACAYVMHKLQLPCARSHGQPLLPAGLNGHPGTLVSIAVCLVWDTGLGSELTQHVSRINACSCRCMVMAGALGGRTGGTGCEHKRGCALDLDSLCVVLACCLWKLRHAQRPAMQLRVHMSTGL